VLDGPAYRGALRQALVAAQPVDESALRNLGTARAEAIRAFLVDDSGISAARVRLLGPEAIEPADDRWVRLELEVTAGD
jgi:hypothetical protein